MLVNKNNCFTDPVFALSLINLVVISVNVSVPLVEGLCSCFSSFLLFFVFVFDWPLEIYILINRGKGF